VVRTEVRGVKEPMVSAQALPGAGRNSRDLPGDWCLAGGFEGAGNAGRLEQLRQLRGGAVLHEHSVRCAVLDQERHRVRDDLLRRHDQPVRQLLEPAVVLRLLHARDGRLEVLHVRPLQPGLLPVVGAALLVRGAPPLLLGSRLC
jgi:hypothetical protein